MQEQITRLLQQYHLHPYVWNIILITIAIILGLLIKFFLFLTYKLKPKNKTEYSVFYSVVTNMGRPINFFLPLVLFNFFLPFLQLDPPMMKIFTRATEI